MFKQIGFLLIVILALTACVPAAPSPTPAASATVALVTATAIPAPTATPAAVNTQTYHNAAVGFELDYPQGWLIDASNEASGTVILWSRKVDGPGRDGVPADVAKIDIVNPAVAVQTLDELVAWEKQIIADSSHTVLHEKPVQLPSGLAAVQMHVSGMGEALVLLTLINNQPLIVAGYGDLSRFTGVAQTLRPMPPTSAATSAGPALASINGSVWHDECAVGGEGGSPANLSAGCIEDAGGVHADGVKTGNERPIGSVKVLLGSGACPSIGLTETTALASGVSYSFTGLSAGTYCVSIDPTQEQNIPLLLPGNWTYPTLTYGVVGATIVLKAGENKFDVNFGWDYQFLPAPSANSGGHGDGPCTYRAAFVADVTVPDNTVVAPGTAFIKTWRVRNDGTCTWGPSGYALSSLAFVSGNPLGAPEGVVLPADVPPGGVIDISLAMKAPSTPGTYRSEWKLAGTGLLVGVGSNDTPLYAQIVVQ